MPNGDLSEMKNGQPKNSGTAGMLYGGRDLAEAMIQLGIAPSAKKSWFNPEVSLGSVISIVIIVAGLVGSWTSFGNKLDSFDKRQEAVDSYLKERRAAVDQKLEEAGKTRGITDQNARDISSLTASLQSVADQLAEGRTKREEGLQQQARETADLRQGLALLSQEVAQLRQSIEGRRDRGPFGQNRATGYPQLPYVLRVSTECPLSPIVQKIELDKTYGRYYRLVRFLNSSGFLTLGGASLNKGAISVGVNPANPQPIGVSSKSSSG